MSTLGRGFQHDTEILIRQVDTHVARLRSHVGIEDVLLAERLAGSLRQLIVATTRSSAADRARVRAAVHYFLLRRSGRVDGARVRPLARDVVVLNEIIRDLGRPDLAVPHDLVPAPASA